MMKGNIAGLMKQAQQMQENMKRAQAELASMEVTGQAGNGLIQVTVSGKYELMRVQIAEIKTRKIYLRFIRTRDGIKSN
jgi:DNA-binding YbaB/EbfC family protein